MAKSLGPQYLAFALTSQHSGQGPTYQLSQGLSFKAWVKRTMAVWWKPFGQRWYPTLRRRVGRCRWGYPKERGGRREKESYLPALGSAVRRLPAVLEIPRGGDQSQGGLKASASPNPSPLFQQLTLQLASPNSCNSHDIHARWDQPYLTLEETAWCQGDSDGA